MKQITVTLSFADEFLAKLEKIAAMRTEQRKLKFGDNATAYSVEDALVNVLLDFWTLSAIEDAVSDHLAKCNCQLKWERQKKEANYGESAQ